MKPPPRLRREDQLLARAVVGTALEGAWSSHHSRRSWDRAAFVREILEKAVKKNTLAVLAFVAVLMFCAGLIGCDTQQTQQTQSASVAAPVAAKYDAHQQELETARFDFATCKITAASNHDEFMLKNGARRDPKNPGWYIGPTRAVQQAATQLTAENASCQAQHDTAVRIIQGSAQ